MEIYIVKSGDTIYSIAEKYGVSPKRLMSDNGLFYGASLAAGQALLILLPKVTHTVSAGESLALIAQKYGTTVIELLRNNPYLASEAYLPAGENIVISYKSEKRGKVRLSGFAYSHINRRILRQILPYLTYIIIFGYGFNEDGTIITVNDADVIENARNFRTAVLLSFSLIDQEGHFDSAKIAPLLTDITFRNAVIEGMLKEIRSRGAQGMDIDMEYIPAEYSGAFADFVKYSAERLHSEGYILNVDLAPKTSASQSGALYEAHSYPALGNAADLAFLMTYEWGYQFGPPFAIAPLKSVTSVLDYALTEIPAGKIYLGIPNYAYDWKLPFVRGGAGAQVIGNISAAYRAFEYNVPIQFDEASQSPFFTYTAEDNSEHIVWFEDVRSLNGKFELTESRGIAGCGYWNLMRSFPQSYLLLNSMFDIEKL